MDGWMDAFIMQPANIPVYSAKLPVNETQKQLTCLVFMNTFKRLGLIIPWRNLQECLKSFLKLFLQTAAAVICLK